MALAFNAIFYITWVVPAGMEEIREIPRSVSHVNDEKSQL
jgi:hypothetical protein